MREIDFVDACRDLSEYVREVYSEYRECIKGIDLDIVALEKLCNENNYPKYMVETILVKAQERLRNIRELCSEAKKELSSGLSDVAKWNRYEDLYLSIKRFNEALRNTIDLLEKTFSKITYIGILATILSLVLLLVIVVEAALFLDGLLYGLLYSVALIFSFRYLRKNTVLMFITQIIILFTYPIIMILGETYDVMLIIAYILLLGSLMYTGSVVNKRLGVLRNILRDLW
ncbi:MAG: hypothetical protein ACP5GI_01295 [Sulfolobales archaeon]